MAVTSATTTDYSKYILSTASSTAQAAGLDIDTSYVNSIMSGDTSGMISGVLASTGMSEEMQAIIGGIADIVMAVIMSGSQAAQPDVDAVATDKSAMNDIAVQGTGVSDNATKQGEQVKDETKSEGDGLSNVVKDADDKIKTTEEQANAEIEKLTEENEQKQKEIEENQKKIEEREAEQKNLAEKIKERKAALGISAASKQSSPQSPADGAGGEETSENSGIHFESCEGSNDAELQYLVALYNANYVEITGLSGINQTLSTEIAANTEKIDETRQNAIQVTTEQSARIDEAAVQITSLATSASSAIEEIQNVLKGEFAQIDDVMLIKLSMSMLKSTVCGTKSGLLAAAAATMEVGSIFSFGATAQKAAELTQAATMEGSAAAKQLANNAMGKILEAQMQSYMNQVWSNLGNTIGVDISSYMNMAMATVDDAQSNARGSAYYDTGDDDYEQPSEDKIVENAKKAVSSTLPGGITIPA